MAGGYNHVSKHNQSPHGFRGVSLLDNLGDAYEAIEELWFMVRYMAGDSDERVNAALDEFYNPTSELAADIKLRIKAWGDSGYGENDVEDAV